MTQGAGAVGIRLDGTMNTLNVDKNTKVHADGPWGTGIMVAYGTNHKLNLAGDVSGMGPKGVGLRLDFGSNLLGDDSEFRGSLMRVLDGKSEELLRGENDNSLVEKVNLSGSLKGEAAAIYIAPSAYVKNINLGS